MNRNRVISGIVVLLVYSFYYQWGGIGMSSLITADDITLRQAACEIVSYIALFAAFILIAVLPKNEKEGACGCR